MEIAIPLIALGGMFVVSNSKSKNSGKEKFNNMGRNSQELPNTHIPPQNFPVVNDRELIDTTQKYPNPNTATDKYFDQTYYENQQNKTGKNVGNVIQEMYSLTGNYIDSKEFKHNNMVPFYGGKIKGQVYGEDMAETILDNMIGSGSQVIKKIEQAPLFKPQDNVQWAYGAPNMSDFYQSRVNPGMKSNNVKPFESEYVGPGLNQGYSSSGSGGFNSGMESRDSWLPKTVDELRISTNPKQEYTLTDHQGPANSIIKNVGIIGKTEKYSPDTFYINSQDRWLTTTGAEKGESLRPIQEVHATVRNITAQAYAGVAAPAEKTASYIPAGHEPSKRAAVELNQASAGAVGSRQSAYVQNHASYTNYTNNRATLKQPNTSVYGFGGTMGAVIAPLLDIMKPSKKTEFVNNMRIYGDTSKAVPENYVINPYDVTPTTIKQTTIYSPQFNISTQVDASYVANASPAPENQRDTTCSGTMGFVGGSATTVGPMDEFSAYMQTNNESKEKSVVNRFNSGGTQIFNQNTNICIAKPEVQDCNIWSPACSITPNGPSTKTYGKINVPQYNNECMSCERISPDILNAFRANPYTHSLTNSV